MAPANAKMLVKMSQKVSIMAYMNTERDNFYDWAKDKPDTSSYARLDRPRLTHAPVRNAMPWGRIAMLALLAVASVAALRLFVL